MTTGHACRFDLSGKGKTLYVGENCEFGDNVHIVAHERVSIGNNVLVASKVFISDTSHGVYKGNNQDAPETPPNERDLATSAVEIGDNVWIGDNVVILPGCTIGSGCIIGANSVVSKSILQNRIAAGVPAKAIKQYDELEKCWKAIEKD